MAHETPAIRRTLTRWYTTIWVRIAALSAVTLTIGCGTPYAQPERAAKDMPDALIPVEVDLGKFECTVPNDKTNSTIQIDFHAFAKMPRYKSQELEPLLESHHNRFRHNVLLHVRKFDRPTLNDPDLTQLREALSGAIREVLPENKVEMIGFYHFQFLEE